MATHRETLRKYIGYPVTYTIHYPTQVNNKTKTFKADKS